MAVTLLTIGHGAVSADEFLSRCARGKLQAIVDVRSFPGSRRHPHFSRRELEKWLPEHGISYAWEPRLGGFRKPRADSPNLGLRNEAFRGYADHAATPEFSAALDEVVQHAGRERTAVMCAETLWWRCHRRILSDAVVLLHGAEVLHVLGDKLEPHRVSEAARIVDGRLVYP